MTMRLATDACRIGGKCSSAMPTRSNHGADTLAPIPEMTNSPPMRAVAPTHGQSTPAAPRMRIAITWRTSGIAASRRRPRAKADVIRTRKGKMPSRRCDRLVSADLWFGSTLRAPRNDSRAASGCPRRSWMSPMLFCREGALGCSRSASRIAASPSSGRPSWVRAMARALRPSASEASRRSASSAARSAARGRRARIRANARLLCARDEDGTAATSSRQAATAPDTSPHASRTSMRNARTIRECGSSRSASSLSRRASQGRRRLA